MSEYYRLLNEGEVRQIGDERHFGISEWTPIELRRIGDKISADCTPHRRKITLPEWRPISEVPFRITILVTAADSTPITAHFLKSESIAECWTHWMPLPDPPKPEKSAEEVAFEKAANGATFRQGEKDVLRWIWLAALEFAKGK